MQVRIPPGVDTGARLRLAGEGEAGTGGGPRGDLYIFITVRDHPVFQRDGLDLVCRVPIPFTRAVLGTEIGLRGFNFFSTSAKVRVQHFQGGLLLPRPPPDPDPRRACPPQGTRSRRPDRNLQAEAHIPRPRREEPLPPRILLHSHLMNTPPTERRSGSVTQCNV